MEDGGAGSGLGDNGMSLGYAIGLIGSTISVATALVSMITGYRQLLAVAGLIAFPIMVWRIIVLHRRSSLDWPLIISLLLVIVGIVRPLIVPVGDKAAVTGGYRDELLLPIGDAETLVVDMALEPGNYAIWAKFYVDSAEDLGRQLLSCTLRAGGDFDRVEFHSEPGRYVTVSLGVMHQVREPDLATSLSCRVAGSSLVSFTYRFQFVKLLAVRSPLWKNQGI